MIGGVRNKGMNVVDLCLIDFEIKISYIEDLVEEFNCIIYC